MVTFERASPVFPVKNVAAALAHYRRLGFVADAYEEHDGDGPVYGFLRRGPVELHLARVPDVDPATNMSAIYVYVDDTDALYAEWRAAHVEGRLVAPVDTRYGLREMVHVDPDGNLWRIGSELAAA